MTQYGFRDYKVERSVTQPQVNSTLSAMFAKECFHGYLLYMKPISTTELFQIGLSSWIIQDGNYANLKTGQLLDFALEFYTRRFRRRFFLKRKRMKQIGQCKYRVTAQVVFVGSEFTVIDFGMLAFKEDLGIRDLKVGDWVKGTIYLGVDPFFYFESGFRIQGIPALIYQWRIERILMETAPFLSSKDAAGRTLMTRDESRRGTKTIQETDAWHDDHGVAEYTLCCRLLGDATSKHRANK